MMQRNEAAGRSIRVAVLDRERALRIGRQGSDVEAKFSAAGPRFANAFPTLQTINGGEYHITLGVDYRPSIARRVE